MVGGEHFVVRSRHASLKISPFVAMREKNQYFHSSTSPYGKWTEAEKLWVPAAAAACAIGGGGNDA